MEKEVKKMDITIPKQDYIVLSVTIKNNGQIVELQSNDLLFFTVSSYPSSKKYEIQKSLENGINYNAQTGKYDIIIDSEDTENLSYDIKYGYDITIYEDGDKPNQVLKGVFTVGDKFTVNEVV